jgi:general secretion pathway protein K
VGDERGFALLAVILVLALLSVVVTEFAFTMRLEASMVRSYRDAVLGRNLAEAGIQQAILETLNESNVHGLDEDGQIVFYTIPAGSTQLKRLDSLPRKDVALGAGTFSYRITDEERRLNVNAGQRDRFDRLLLQLKVDKQERDIVLDSIDDWRDTNDTAKANGAENDYYLKLPVPYTARNGNFQDTAELLQVRGITPEMYYGKEGAPGLQELVTARSRGNVNLNTAPREVLAAVGFSDAEISEIMQTRVKTPYTSAAMTRFGGRRVTISSTTFRIEAEGSIGGDVKTRLVAIVQKTPGSGTSTPNIAVLSWRTLPRRSEPPQGEGKS